MFAAAVERMEIDVLDLLAQTMRQGGELTDWHAIKLTQFTQFRNDLGTLTTAHGERLTRMLGEVLEYTANETENYVRDSMLEANLPRSIDNQTTRAKLLAAIESETRTLHEFTRIAHREVYRSAQDAYRAIVAQATPAGLSGVHTMTDTQRLIMRKAADRGLAAFVDKSGRRWRLDTWAEMAARTSLSHASILGQATIWADEGYTLAVVNDGPDECGLCRPFEKQIISLTADTGPRPVTAPDGTVHMVTPFTSLDRAQEAGLHHPNCRHVFTLYIPGYSQTGDAMSDPAGYELEQEQRSIERNLRKWKRRHAAALDTQTAMVADAKIQEWEDRLTYHIDRNPGLLRRYYREETITV